MPVPENASLELNTAPQERLPVLMFGRFWDTQFGGVERHVDALMCAMQNEVAYTNVVAHRAGVNVSPRPAPPQQRVLEVPSLGVVASTALCPTMPWRARQAAQAIHAPIAHLHLPDPMSHVATWALPKKIKRVITWHSDIVKQKNLLKLYRPFLKNLLQNVDAVMAPTQAHYNSSNDLRNFLPPEKFHVVPFGFDYDYLLHPSAERVAQIRQLCAPHLSPQLIPQSTHRSAGQSNTPQIIFALGRHVYYKGFEYLIQALHYMPQAHLILGGTGPLTESYRALAQQCGVAQRITFAGKIADADLANYYAAAQVFCLPSIEPSEAFGIVQVEAMVCGVPVVCCELNNGVTEVNQHQRTGLVVPLRNAPALAQALKQILENAEFHAQLAKSARARAVNDFSMAAMRQATLRVYQQVLKT